MSHDAQEITMKIMLTANDGEVAGIYSIPDIFCSPRELGTTAQRIEAAILKTLSDNNYSECTDCDTYHTNKNWDFSKDFLCPTCRE